MSTVAKVSKFQLKAKEKLEAVMAMQGRGEPAAIPNRIGTTRHVSTGNDVVNSVSHPPRRPSTGGVIKRINSQPAY